MPRAVASALTLVVLLCGCGGELRHRVVNQELSGWYMGKSSDVHCFVNRLKFSPEPGWFAAQITLMNESPRRWHFDSKKVKLRHGAGTRTFDEGGVSLLPAHTTKSYDFLFRTGGTLREATLLIEGLRTDDGQTIKFEADIRGYVAD